MNPSPAQAGGASPLTRDTASPPGAAPPAAAEEPACVEEGLTRCPYVINVPDAEADADPATPAASAAAITVTDLASFSPATGELIVQPDGWGVRGLPTNFAATATEHVRSGTLLGRQIEVRWRPVRFTFDYGDGTTITVADAGTRWRSADDTWSATSTSHEYAQRGMYRASLTVTFEADIDTGGGWRSVPGTLQRAAPTEQVRIFTVQTVLTRGDCIEHPDDPGCTA